MSSRLLLPLAILIIGCQTSTKLPATSTAENNKDVLILANLIRDYLKQTNARTLNLDELVRKDSLKRITKNFESAVLVPKGGYISVYYTFSKSRDTTNIRLTDKEKQTIGWLEWETKKINKPCNGEIRLAYGERFYHFKRIIVQKD